MPRRGFTLRGLPGATESFEWVAPIAKYITPEHHNLFKAVALTVCDTGVDGTPILLGWEDHLAVGHSFGQVPHEHRVWSETELRIAARSISRAPIDLNHGDMLWQGEEFVGETWFGDWSEKSRQVEVIGQIYFDDLYELIGKPAVDGGIEFVSVDSSVFKKIPVNGLLMQGVYFNRLSLLLGEYPGDVNARIEKFVPEMVLEQLTVTRESVMKMEDKHSTNVTEQLRQKYNISAGTSKKTQFLWAPTDDFADWAFPVRDNSGQVQKDLVENVLEIVSKTSEAVEEAALKRFHQTTPEVQSAIKGELCNLAKELGIQSTICGELPAKETVVLTEEKVRALIKEGFAEYVEANRKVLVEGLTSIDARIKEGLKVKAADNTGGGALLAPVGADGPLSVGWESLSDEERRLVVVEAIRNTPLKDIQRMKQGKR